MMMGATRLWKIWGSANFCSPTDKQVYLQAPRKELDLSAESYSLYLAIDDDSATVEYSNFQMEQVSTSPVLACNNRQI
jgi:hypothetical protein